MKKKISSLPVSRAVSEPSDTDIFRMMADGAPVPLWMADASGQSTFHNQAWLDFTGRSSAEMSGSAWLESLHPDDVARCLKIFRDAVAARRKFEMEYRLRRRDGQYRRVLDVGAPVHAPDGSFYGFVGANFDITEREKTKEQLEFTNNILVTRNETSPDGVMVVDADRRIVLCNRRFREIWNIPEEQIAAARTDEPILKSGAKQVKDPQKFYDRVTYIYGHPDESGFDEIKFKDGRIFEGYTSTLNDPEGRYLGRVWSLSDITARRRSEEILRGRNLVLEQLATGAPQREILTLIVKTAEETNPGLICSILLLDREAGRLRHGAAPGLPEFYNNAIDGLAIGPEAGSCGAAACTGRRVIVEDIMTHPNWAPYRDIARRAGLRACWSQPILSSSGEVLGTFALYYREVRAPGARDLEFIESMAHLAGIAIEHRRAEQESAAAREQAEIANRTKTEFLANMSHELRSPLNSVLGLAEIMKDELFGSLGSERYRGYANDIHQSAKHLLDVITDILDISKIEAGKLSLIEDEVDVEAAVETCMRLMHPRASEAKVSLVKDIPAGLPKIHADSRKVKQIVLNLLSNAVKFTPKGGTVTVSANLDGSREMILTVADTGIGIAPANIEKALTPFAQIDSSLSRRYEGTGLGLPITKALIELHGGRLAIASVLGKGTAVTVTFPAARVLNGAAPCGGAGK